MRRTEVQAAVDAWQAEGGTVLFGTLTVSHRAGHRLGSVWDGVAAGWQAITSGRRWGQLQDEFGSAEGRTVRSGSRRGEARWARRIHYIKATETTIGANGWHVHLHVLFFLRAGVLEPDAALFADELYTRWRSGLERVGLTASRKRGTDVKLLGSDGAVSDLMAGYFTKSVYGGAGSLSAEMTWGQHTKRPKGGNRTPFQLLADVVATGDADDLDTWHEWERGSKGRRQLTWSVGLRERVGLTHQELTDEEIADQDDGGDDVATINAATWQAIVNARQIHALIAAWRESDDVGRAFLTRWRC